MRLRQAHGHMHVAEIRVPSQALVVKLGKGRHKAITFSRCQRLGVLADTHHHRHRADQHGADARLDLDLAIVNARMPEVAGRKKWDRRPIDRACECQTAGKRPPRAASEPNSAAAGSRCSGDLYVDGRRESGKETETMRGILLLVLCYY